MTNGEKYKTAKERAEAFKEFFKPFSNPKGMSNYPVIDEIMNWLDLEAPAEEPLPCPFCGHKVQQYDSASADDSYHQYSVYCAGCEYSSGYSEKSMSDAIAAHNRVARADAKEK